MAIPVLKLPDGLHLVLDNVTSFRYEYCDEKYFDFVYTTIGLDKEFRIRVSNEFKTLLNQKINFIYDVAEVSKKNK